MNRSENDPRTYVIIGAAMEVHREMKPGFLEAVCQEALAHEFDLRNIPYQREVALTIQYKGKRLDKKYIADFICYDCVVVESKAQTCLTDIDIAQTINYLKLTQQKIGLLINFGSKSLEYKRLIQSV